MFNLKSILPIKKKPNVKKKYNRKHNMVYVGRNSVTAKLAPEVFLELDETCKYIGAQRSDFVAAAVENYILYYRGYIDDKEDGYV